MLSSIKTLTTLATACTSFALLSLVPAQADAYEVYIDDESLLFIGATDSAGEDISLFSFGSDNMYLMVNGAFIGTYNMNNYAEVALEGGEGNDGLNCNVGLKCTLLGRGGDDFLTSGPMSTEIDMDGGAGDDLLIGEGVDLSMNGGNNDDTISCNSSPCSASGGHGNDTITGSSGDDSLYGGEGDDEIVGMMGADTIGGGKGDDLLSGEFSGSDTDTHVDTIDGGDDFDTVDGAGASDIVTNVEN